MDLHDPYNPILAGLNVHEGDYEFLHILQKYVEKLRQAYRVLPPEVDYSCFYTRCAYMLAYYPHYIEPLYRLLERLPSDQFKEKIPKNHLRGCFIGSGPAPEVIGWVSFLDRFYPDVEYAIAYLLDRRSDSWYGEQKITRRYLAPDYWPERRLILKPLAFDLCEPFPESNKELERAINRSTLFVMQNFLNEISVDPGEALSRVLELIRRIPERSLFLIIQTYSQGVKHLIGCLEDEVTKEKLGRVLLPVKSSYIELRSNLQVPHVILDNIFTGADGLIEKNQTKFCSSAIVRQTIAAHMDVRAISN